jgi:hypothetical protein
MAKQLRMSAEEYHIWVKSISKIKSYRLKNDHIGVWSNRLGKIIHSIRQPADVFRWTINGLGLTFDNGTKMNSLNIILEKYDDKTA